MLWGGVLLVRRADKVSRKLADVSVADGDKHVCGDLMIAFHLSNRMRLPMQFEKFFTADIDVVIESEWRNSTKQFTIVNGCKQWIVDSRRRCTWLR